MNGLPSTFSPPPGWLAAQLAVAPWLFWLCPPCWVMGLLSPGGTGGRCDPPGSAPRG